MELLPQLTELYEEYHKGGLEIIGVAFETQTTTPKLKIVCDKHNLPWPQVLVPHDEKTRNYWQEVTGIGGIPRVFLIDRDGVLRADTHANLKDEITRLVTGARRQKRR